MLAHATATSTRADADADSSARRVALIQPGAELLRAARSALEPWQVELVVVDAASPGPTAPRANEVAAEIAQRYAASAVVWISEHKQGYALWLYDLASQRVIERPLPSAPPFDEATAAAVALSVKTLLRHSTTAPVDERYGAPNAPDEGLDTVTEPAPESKPAPETTASVASSTRADAQVPGDLAGSASRSSPAWQPRRASWLELELQAGLGFNLGPSDGELARFGFAASMWPRAARIGVALAVDAGPSARVDAPQLQARLLTTSLFAAAKLRSDPTRALRAWAALGPGLHVIALDGQLPLEAQATHLTRVAPVAQLELGVDWLLASEFFVGVRGDAALRLRADDYYVRATRALALSRAVFAARLGFGVMLAD